LRSSWSFCEVVVTYTVLVYEDKDDGGFWAKVAELPGCYTSGETLEEVEENVKDAIAAYLESLEDSGEPLPEQATHKLEVSVA
jgi:predicted RNase H-like HicB family nuclease